MAQNNCYIRILLDIHISPFMSFLFFALLVKTLHGPLALIFAICHICYNICSLYFTFSFMIFNIYALDL